MGGWTYVGAGGKLGFAPWGGVVGADHCGVAKE
jgi:hypothetical protein